MLLKLLVYLEAASVGALCGISLFEFGVEKLFISIGDCPSIIIDYTLASLSSVLYETSMWTYAGSLLGSVKELASDFENERVGGLYIS